MKLIGIDPGKKGGLAFFEDENLIEYIIMPTYTNDKDKEMVDFVEVGKCMKKCLPDVVYIELVHARPLEGRSSIWAFAFGTGGIHGVCGALEIPVKTANPKTWQDFLMGKKEKGFKHEKEETIQFVKNTYKNVCLLASPRCKKDHDGLADAIAIGLYGVRKENTSKII